MSKEAMKRFLIETPVENAEGSQTWYVDATSEAEALKKYEQGGCDLYASNVDVTSLGEPEISGETTLDNFGDFAEQPAQRPIKTFHDGKAWPVQEQAQQEPFGFAVMENPIAPPAQRQWLGLTPEQAVDLYKATETDNRMVLIDAVEAKLKEKNT